MSDQEATGQGNGDRVGNQMRPETGGVGVLLDRAVAGVALAASAWSGAAANIRAVILSGSRAYATDGFRLHVADLPAESPAVNPPLLLEARPLHFALRNLAFDQCARIAAIDGGQAMVVVPQEGGGELITRVPAIDAPALVLGEVFDRHGSQPAAVVTVQAGYLREAIEALSGDLTGSQTLTLIAWQPEHNRARPRGLALITNENDGRQRAALIMPCLAPPQWPWWWQGERRVPGRRERQEGDAQ